MYNYEKEKPKVFLEENQRDFLKMRDGVKKLPELFTMDEAMNYVTGGSWLTMAYVDRLVEIGELREIKQEGFVAGQYRIFKKI